MVELASKVDLTEEISEQSVEGAARFLLTASSEM